MPKVDGYREKRAPAELAGVVACLWRDETSAPRRQRVLPDGCMDIIWMDGAVYVAGPDTCAFVTTLGPGQLVAGLRFRPGAAPGVLRVPAWALRDRRVRLDDLWPGTTIAEQIAEAPDPAVTLAAAVAPWAATQPDPALDMVLARLRTGSSVAATADALGWTERALHRRCRDAFGYGPSVLRRIVRFQGALRLAGQGVPFATTAARAGYADQAHLAREVRALAGVSLGELTRTRRAGQVDSGANRSTVRPSGSCSTA
ncbi:MAG TPA: AraC family transcriptional regulator [Pseudonocardiaceae bacterium]|jgi:AraC-like DNA-binding protein|nr:AraC family transcriptional regulator [Pseudonocardiaceae bacterium]